MLTKRKPKELSLSRSRSKTAPVFGRVKVAKRRSDKDISIANLKKVLQQTATDVRADNLGRGIAMTVLIDNQVVKIHPDGRRQVLKEQVAPPVTVTKTRFRLG